jgi:hypothetical protein
MILNSAAIPLFCYVLQLWTLKMSEKQLLLSFTAGSSASKTPKSVFGLNL